MRVTVSICIILIIDNTWWQDRDSSMATVPLQPPAPFCFTKTDEWQKWKRRFEPYRIAKKIDECQASTLLYCLGPDSDDVLTTTRISDDDRKKYSKIIEKLDEYFKVRHNVIFERARFNRWNQQLGESADNYITALHQLAQGCEYGAMADELIRDRLVVGIRDESLSERLQIESKLTLEQAKKFIRQREAIHQQQSILKGSNDTQGEALEPMYINKRIQGKRNNTQQMPRPAIPMQAKYCRRCGKPSKPRQVCPASNATCFRCNRKVILVLSAYQKLWESLIPHCTNKKAIHLIMIHTLIQFSSVLTLFSLTLSTIQTVANETSLCLLKTTQFSSK